ncbi:MAG TPA: TlpA disulfide reductase family protein [Opitutaceae bacterium]|nr:TlpA disulfide reductase family protein [Opitutaceae bacterium]
MNLRLFIAAGALLGAAISASAADATPAGTAPAPAPANPDQAIQTQLNVIVTRVKAKLANGEQSPAQLADDIKAFDDLAAAHRGEKTDAVASVLYVEATLYWRVLQDYDHTAALLQQVKDDFPNTKYAPAAAKLLEGLQQEKQSMEIQASLKPGVMFPDFAEKDLSGQPLSVGRFKGKVVLVDFWATWCPPCRAELPNVVAAYQKYHDKGFEIVGVSLDKDESQLKSFLAEHKMTWPQYFDGQYWQTKLATKYGITSIPATYLIGPDGKIVAKDLRGEALDQELGRLLAK